MMDRIINHEKRLQKHEMERGQRQRRKQKEMEIRVKDGVEMKTVRMEENQDRKREIQEVLQVIVMGIKHQKFQKSSIKRVCRWIRCRFSDEIYSEIFGFPFSVIQRQRDEDDSSDDNKGEEADEYYDGDSGLEVKSAVSGGSTPSNESPKKTGLFGKKLAVQSPSKKKNKLEVHSPKKKNISMPHKKKKPPKAKAGKAKKKVNGSKTQSQTPTKEDDDGELPELAIVSKMEATWNELSFRALNDHTWNEDDCERLIDEACIINKRVIKVHSMWLPKCNEYNKQNNKTKLSLLKFCVIIGYPHGQQCTQAKIGEIKFCLKQNIDKIILLISCGKIINRDWKYIKKEVMSVNKVIGNKCQLVVKHPKSDKIGAQTQAMFDEHVRKIIEK